MSSLYQETRAAKLKAQAGDDEDIINTTTGDMGKCPTICLFLEHKCPEMSHSLYMIQPPLDSSDYDQMKVDSEGFMTISEPLLTFRDKHRFLPYPASVNIGSKIYIFGGMMHFPLPEPCAYPLTLPHQVNVFDTDHPSLGIYTVASMNAPKDTPCVFVADGMIYALGSPVPSFKNTIPDSKGSGFFERYHPKSDHWEVLPDPPSPFLSTYLDEATVVGRLVFIYSHRHVVFNLDTLDWEPCLQPSLAAPFPFGSLFVEDTASLYQLRGLGTWKPGNFYYGEQHRGKRLEVVKTGPLTITGEGDYVSTLLNSPCLVSPKNHVMAQDIDLDDMYFTECVYSPWRNLFHMGGRVFCYVATAQLVDLVDYRDFTHNEPNSRGVLIKFFEDNCNGDGNNVTKFRTLASFCYKINTDFPNSSFSIRCFIHGTVPDSWIKAPLIIKPESMKTERRMYAPKQGQRDVDNISALGNCQVENTKTRETGTLDPRIMSNEIPKRRMYAPKQGQRRMYAPKQGQRDVDNISALGNCQVENTKTRETGALDPTKLISAREEITRLTAELAEKNELLKAYEARLTKSVDMNG